MVVLEASQRLSIAGPLEVKPHPSTALRVRLGLAPMISFQTLNEMALLSADTFTTDCSWLLKSNTPQQKTRPEDTPFANAVRHNMVGGAAAHWKGFTIALLLYNLRVQDTAAQLDELNVMGLAGPKAAWSPEQH